MGRNLRLHGDTLHAQGRRLYHGSAFEGHVEPARPRISRPLEAGAAPGQSFRFGVPVGGLSAACGRLGSGRRTPNGRAEGTEGPFGNLALIFSRNFAVFSGVSSRKPHFTSSSLASAIFFAASS